MSISRATNLTQHSRPTSADRWTRVNWIAVAALTLLLIDAGLWWQGIRSGAVLPAQGLDLQTYRTAAQSWLATGQWFAPYQLAGPYAMWGSGQPILYPPNAIPLFAAFTVLPGFLWWAVPLGVIGWSLRRDSRLILVLALLAWPQTISLIWAGNPVMWMAAFLALSLRWPGFAPFVLLKPILAPFSLIGIRGRGWWIGAGLLVVVSLPFAGLWLDYLTVLRNAHGDQGWLYLAGNVPLMLVPIVGGAPRSPGSST